MVKGRIHIVLLVFFILIALAECAGVNQRAQTLKTKYPQWNDKSIQAVAARRVEPGMTMDMVREALGKKGEVSFKPNGDEIWTYFMGIMTDHQRVPLWVPVYRVYFRDGIVVGTEGDRSEVNPWF